MFVAYVQFINGDYSFIKNQVKSSTSEYILRLFVVGRVHVMLEVRRILDI